MGFVTEPLFGIWRRRSDDSDRTDPARWSSDEAQDGPVSKMGMKGIKPLLLDKEMKKTAELLRGKGVATDSWTLPGMPASFCSITDPTRRKVFAKAQDRDAVVVFSCESGHKCVADIVPDKKAVAAMNAKGLLRLVTRRKARTV